MNFNCFKQGKALGAVDCEEFVASSREPLAGMGGALPMPALLEPSPTYLEWLWLEEQSNAVR